MNALTRIAGATLAFAMLGSGCGGGGGGGGGRGAGFTSFAAIAPNQTVVMDGTAVTASGNQAVQPNGDYSVTTSNLNAVGGGTVRLSYDLNRTLRAIEISTPQSSASFDRSSPGHNIVCSGPTCVASNPNGSGVAIDAYAADWNYQTFGLWALDTSPFTWSGGAISVGAATAGSAVPLVGNATFTGLAAGFYFDNFGTPNATAASMTANVNFGNQSIGFSTSNTTLVNANTGVQSSNIGLNMTGTLSYAPGVNSFSGTLNTANGQLSGQGAGRFYGPAAEEIGGVYSLQGSGGTMFGGFGGRR